MYVYTYVVLILQQHSQLQIIKKIIVRLINLKISIAKMTYRCNSCNKPCKSLSGYTRHLQKCLLYHSSNKRQKTDTNNSKFIETNTEDNNQINMQTVPSII